MLPEIKGTLLPNPPLRELSLERVLGYYDRPRILLERDPTGQLYLVWWSDEDDGVERWICLPLSEVRLRAITSGAIAPRYAMDHPEDGYLLAVDTDTSDTIVRAVKTTTAAFPQDALPRPEADLMMPMPISL